MASTQKVTSNISQSPHEEIMVVDRNAMYDIEQQILHDAHNLFFIRVVALDWTEGFGQNAVDCPWHI